MWPFKKKKESFIPLYKTGSLVYFRYRNEVMAGYVYSYKKDKNGITEYDIQIGGECPTLKRDIKESDILGLK